MPRRRQFPRYELEVSVSVRCPGGPEGSLTGKTGNMSRGGLCMELSQALVLGNEVFCDLSLPALGSHNMPVTLPARVVWCTAIENIYQVGLQWAPLSRDLLGQLERFLQLQNRPA